MKLDKLLLQGLLALALCGSTWVMADRLDTLETYEAVDYCTVNTSIFMQGADAFAFNRGRDPATIAPDEWVTLNPREQAYFTKLFHEGYDAVARLANEKQLSDEDRNIMLQTYFEGCVAMFGTKIKD